MVQIVLLLHGVLNVTHRFDGTKVGHWHLRNGKRVREDTMEDDDGKKYTKEEIDEINNPESNNG